MSGLLCGIGLAFLSTVPAIESQTDRFRLLTCIVVIGGMCRVFALRDGLAPSTVTLLAIGMEVLVTPLLCLWQARIAGRTLRMQLRELGDRRG